MSNRKYEFTRYKLEGNSPVQVTSRGMTYGVWEIVDSYAEPDSNGVMCSFFGGASFSVAAFVCEALNKHGAEHVMDNGRGIQQREWQYLEVIWTEGLAQAGFH
jgi:methylmalonyl-CoA mutase cobalamin-binding subunit